MLTHLMGNSSCNFLNTKPAISIFHYHLRVHNKIRSHNYLQRAHSSNKCFWKHTTEKPKFAECLGLCRVPEHGHSAKMWFAECHATSTRQTSATRHARALPSAGRRQRMTLGKLSHLPSAGPAALGKAGARAQHARPPCAAR